MAVPILPVLSALSNLATTAWDTYARIKHARESITDKSAVSSRLEKLEDTCLEQAEMLSELSKDLEQFGQAIQAEMEQARKRQILLTWLCSISFVVASAALGFSIFLLSK